MGDLSRIDDADLYLDTVGSTCVECGRQDSKARLFMPPYPMHIGNIVILCDHCEKTYRPMSIDVFARVAMNKYELEEKIFGARLPVETDRNSSSDVHDGTPSASTPPGIQRSTSRIRTFRFLSRELGKTAKGERATSRLSS